MILVINGSPIFNGNLHRMLLKIVEDTAEDYTIITLADLKIGPCRACARCASTNRCIQADDMLPLYDLIVGSDSMLLGTTVHFGQANAATQTFLERMYPLRHRLPLTRNKPAAVVCVAAEDAADTARTVSYQLKRFFNFNVVGSVIFNSYTPPCYVCGFGTTCRYGRPFRWLTPGEFECFDKITPDMFKRFEDSPETVSACEQMSWKLRAELDFIRP